MPSNLDKLIRQVEEDWIEPLYAQCARQFSRVHLPSHDETHHLRVWNYAKMLLYHADMQGIPLSEKDIERLIIAVFFHDQGMSETFSKEHGKISRHICKAFFQASNITPLARFDSVLQAIENHDQKDYQFSNSKDHDFDIQKYLNIADDLDALGIIGAYRYLEIYLLRKIKIELLPEAVLNNISLRYKYFSETFASAPSLGKAHYQRYIEARNYFKDLSMQLKLVEYDPNSYQGPLGVFNYVRDKIIGDKRILQEAIILATSSDNDFYVRHFFERLGKELS